MKNSQWEENKRRLKKSLRESLWRQLVAPELSRPMPCKIKKEIGHDEIREGVDGCGLSEREKLPIVERRK